MLSISKSIFLETFEQHNTEANMQDYVNKNFTEAKLLDEVNNPESIFYLLRLNDASAGYIKINFGKAQTELKQSNCVEIERIYVVKELHGKKLGEKLMYKAFDIAKEKKWTLYGWAFGNIIQKLFHFIQSMALLLLINTSFGWVMMNKRMY